MNKGERYRSKVKGFKCPKALLWQAERPILGVYNPEKTKHLIGDPHSHIQPAFTEDLHVPGTGLAARFAKKSVVTTT